MESHRNFNSPPLNSVDDAVSPIAVMKFAADHRRHYSPIYDPYATTDSSSSSSPLLKYLCSGDSSTAVSPALFVSPVKVEEDVLVMDGIPVPPPPQSSNKTPSFVGGKSSSSSSSGSGGSGGGSDNSKGKLEICRYWDNYRFCRFGHKCQFAHERDDLRFIRFSAKNKLEMGKPYFSSEGSTSSPYGTKSRVKITSPPSLPTRMALSSLPVQDKQASGISICRAITPNTAAAPSSYWTPDDDGIEVTLPLDLTGKNKSTKEVVDAYVRNVLYGNVAKKRLPVFEEICAE